MKFPRFFEDHKEEKAPDPPVVERRVVQIDADELRAMSNVFSAPRWLRDAGIASWLLAGVAILLAGIVWLLAVTATIVDPVAVGAIVAVVAAPIVGLLARHRIPRAAGAGLVLVGIVVVVAFIVLIVVGGITSQADSIRAQAEAAAPRVQSWLKDVGIDSGGAKGVTDSVSRATPETISTFVHGIVGAIGTLASVAFGLSFAALAIFFLLKDGPSMRAFVDRHMGVAPTVARVISGGVIRSLRRYFAGVTLVAAFNGVVVGIGALILDVPLAGTIAVVTFVTAYIPYLGAFVAGAFAVILALGAKGTTTAIIMLVIVLLANGLLQNIFQPIAFGATLKLNPLVVLIVTIGAGCLFGMIGLVLAAPLTSAAVQINRELSEARRTARAGPAPVADPAREA
jgi:predicted PurR-regulated permease PerM